MKNSNKRRKVFHLNPARNHRSDKGKTHNYPADDLKFLVAKMRSRVCKGIIKAASQNDRRKMEKYAEINRYFYDLELNMRFS